MSSTSQPFAPMFRNGRYLRLMSMAQMEGGPTLDEALDELERCARAAPNVEAAIEELFAIQNWRHAIVACTAMIMGVSSRRLVDIAWSNLPMTWASPQIVVTMSLVDPRFDVTAAALIDRLRVDLATAKTLGALTAVTRRRSPARATLAPDGVDGVIEKQEFDVGFDVANGWMRRVLDQNIRGRLLR